MFANTPAREPTSHSSTLEQARRPSAFRAEKKPRGIVSSERPGIRNLSEWRVIRLRSLWLRLRLWLSFCLRLQLVVFAVLLLPLDLRHPLYFTGFLPVLHALFLFGAANQMAILIELWFFFRLFRFGLRRTYRSHGNAPKRLASSHHDALQTAGLIARAQHDVIDPRACQKRGQRFTHGAGTKLCDDRL